MPGAVRRTRPSLPRRVASCDLVASARANELKPYAANISESTQPKWPFAYSLIMRQAGENSGLSTCKLRSNKNAAAEAAMARRAASGEIVDLALSETRCSMKIRLLCLWHLGGALHLRRRCRRRISDIGVPDEKSPSLKLPTRRHFKFKRSVA